MFYWTEVVVGEVCRLEGAVERSRMRRMRKKRMIVQWMIRKRMMCVILGDPRVV